MSQEPEEEAEEEHENSVQQGDAQKSAPGMAGRRRLGRPSKPTWDYLSDLGRRQLLDRATPTAHEIDAPRPLPRSEELLQQAPHIRQPLATPRAIFEARNNA